MSTDVEPPQPAQAAGKVMDRLHHVALPSGAALLAADIAGFLTCFALIHLTRSFFWDQQLISWTLWPAVTLWLVLRFFSGLYPPFGLAQPEELRRSVLTTVMAMAVHVSMLIAAGEYSGFRIAGLLTWPCTPILTYFTRSVVKIALLKSGRYGTPYIIIGTESSARRVIREMRSDPEAGMVPIAAFGNLGRLGGKDIDNVPVLGTLEDTATDPLCRRAKRAMIAISYSDMDQKNFHELTIAIASIFPRVQIFGEARMPGNMWSRPRPIGPYLAPELRQARLSEGQRRAKRLFDIAISVLLLLLTAPLIGAAALAVKIASPGPAFFSQTREGMRGNSVQIFKIRTMVPDAEARLTKYLTRDPEAQLEYEKTLKLRHDPRIIPGVGNFLRRTSIDELPQFYNIVRGDMSLVGPRIMPKREVDLYSSKGQDLRRDVPPGLTGLWQVTSRSNSDLKVRELADSFYVSNWSIWLDGWILLRSVRVVLAGSGAY